MKKQINSYGSNPLGTRKIFKNIPNEKSFSPVKNWYGTISTSTGSFLVTYETDVRSAAVSYFEEKARLANGKMDKYIGTLTK